MLNNFCFSITSTTFTFRFSIENNNKPSKRKPAKSSVPSTREKEAMKRELDRKLPKLNWVAVQTAPLEQSTVFTPPVGDLGTAALPYDGPSNVAASSVDYPDERYDYGDCYGGYQATRFNSTQVDDKEADAKADYRYHQYRHPTPAPGYMDAYSEPYSDSNAQGLCASHVKPQRESQAPQALDHMERIMEKMERNSSVSSKQLQAFLGQGESISLISLQFLKIHSFAL
jgi:hypothetical protein